MKRREFLRNSTLAAGAVLAAAPVLAAKATPAIFKGYTEVDAALFQGVNRAADPANRSLLEKKHLPLIEAPSRVKAGEPFTVTVTVGEVLHPMSAPHHIAWVELFAGNEPAGRAEFSPLFGQPRVSFSLVLDRPVTLVVREYCNLHGLWETRQEVTVA